MFADGLKTTLLHTNLHAWTNHSRTHKNIVSTIRTVHTVDQLALGHRSNPQVGVALTII